MLLDSQRGAELPLWGAGLRSAIALLLVLVQTFSALGLGFFCARYGFIDVQRGDMQALQFFIGKIALPLLVFKIVATSDVGSIDVGVILACTLSKVAVYLLTSVMTLCAYRSKDSVGRRILTATVFGFFTTASNDLAVGFPVINAIYGDEMNLYLAANVLVFQTLIQPMAIVLFEVGQALSQSKGGTESDSRSGWPELLLNLARRISLNPIMIATLLGVVYSLFFSFTLVADGSGVLQLPPPFGGIIKLWTSPFTMMFLFLNGVSLRSASIALWPAVLVLMKVVVCAYTGYGLSHLFVDPANPKAQQFRDFTFFYGTIPAGGAPLIYAQLFDCGVDVIAAGSILCLMLAGPIEFVTALFLNTSNTPLNYSDVRTVMSAAAQSSGVCAGIFVLLVSLGCWGGTFSSRAIGVFGCATLLYEATTLLIMANPATGCAPFGRLLFLYAFLQNVCYILVVYIEYHMGTRWQEGRRPRSHVVTAVVLAVAALATSVVPYGNGFHEMCGVQLEPMPASVLVGWNAVLFALIVAFAIRGRVLKQRVGGLLPARARRARRRSLTGLLSRPLLGDLAAGPGAWNGDSAGRQPDLPPAQESSGSSLSPQDVVVSEPSGDDDLVVGRASSAEASSAGASSAGDGEGVATCLVVLQGVRSLMGAINGSAEALAVDPGANTRGFTPMLILEDILEHGQGCFLLLAVLCQPGVLRHMKRLFLALWACGCCRGWQGSLLEVDPTTPLGAQPRRWRSMEDLADFGAAGAA